MQPCCWVMWLSSNTLTAEQDFRDKKNETQINPPVLKSTWNAGKEEERGRQWISRQLLLCTRDWNCVYFTLQNPAGLFFTWSKVTHSKNVHKKYSIHQKITLTSAFPLGLPASLYSWLKTLFKYRASIFSRRWVKETVFLQKRRIDEWWCLCEERVHR